MVVHGRDDQLTRSLFDLLRAVGLQPLEWETLVQASGSTAPYLGEVVRLALESGPRTPPAARP